MANLNAQQILHIIVSECKNSCTTPSHTFDYFARHYANKVDLQDVIAIANILNFDRVRENEDQLFELTK